MNPVTLSTNTTRDPARVWLLRIQLGLYRFPGYPRLAACIRNLEPGNQKSARVTTIGYRYPIPSWLLRIQTIARIRSLLVTPYPNDPAVGSASPFQAIKKPVNQ